MYKRQANELADVARATRLMIDKLHLHSKHKTPAGCVPPPPSRQLLKARSIKEILRDTAGTAQEAVPPPSRTLLSARPVGEVMGWLSPQAAPGDGGREAGPETGEPPTPRSLTWSPSPGPAHFARPPPLALINI